MVGSIRTGAEGPFNGHFRRFLGRVGGCGFAPVVAADRPFMAEVMEGVKEIPKAALDGADSHGR